MPESHDEQELKKAYSLHQNGRLNEAAALYRQLIAKNPANFHALHFLGVIEASVGNFAQAKILMARSLSIQPPNIQFAENYATILCQTQDYKSALDVCRSGLQINKNNAPLLYVNAVSLFKLDRFSESLAQFGKLLSLQPKHVVALNERGSVLAAMKRHDAALASIEQALALAPQYADAHLNRGNLLGELNRGDEALLAYDKALKLNPALADAWLGRGNVLRAMKRPDESIAAYDKALGLSPALANAWLGRGNVLSELKRYDESFAAYDKALALSPDFADAWVGRGTMLGAVKRYDEALTDHDHALKLKPDLAEAWLGRGSILCMLHRYDEALADIDRALSLKPDLPDAWLSRANVLLGLDRPTEAFTALDKAISIKPNFADAITSRIFALDFVNEAGFEEQQKARGLWWRQVGAAIAERSPKHYANAPDPDRRIKVGYISADFNRHSAALCFKPMLLNHDKSRFDITCYSCTQIKDELTTDFQRAVNQWRDVAQLSDDKLCELIRAEQIDILVDLSGHTAGNRLEVFARKPAPVQVTAGATGTGLPTFDYLFSDPVACPPAVRHLFAEKVFDLPSIMTIEPLPEQLRPSDPPVLATGHVTFGVFNRASKVSDDVVSLWARILQSVPRSRILLKHYGFDDASTRDRLSERFAMQGISADRIAFLGTTSRLEHLAAFKDVDISLDPFPHNGGISTLESLQMGVPVVAILGNSVSSRAAGAILTSAGLGDWVSESAEAYLAIAVKFAAMPEHLKGLRYELSTRVATSPVGNGAMYTRAMETAYQTMWADYCRTVGLPPGTLPEENRAAASKSPVDVA